MRRQPTIVQYDLEELSEINNSHNNNNNGGGSGGGEQGKAEAGGVTFDEGGFKVSVADSFKMRRRNRGNDKGGFHDDGPGKKMTLKKPLEVCLKLSCCRRLEH